MERFRHRQGYNTSSRRQISEVGEVKLLVVGSPSGWVPKEAGERVQMAKCLN